MPNRSVKCKSGIRGWRGRLQDQYDSKQEFLSYDGVYELAKRLGYASAEDAWDANPLVEGSVNPSDFRKVATPPPRIIKVFPYNDGSQDSVLLLNEGQNFNELFKEFNALDDELCRTGREPEGWKPFSEFLRDKGVVVIEPLEVNLEAHR